MKVIFFIAIIAAVALCNTNVQIEESELALESQVIFANSSLQSYVDFLKGYFVSDSNAPLYKQCDSKWGGNYISSKTICQVGCLMSSVSMGLSAHGKTIGGGAINPGTLNSWLKSNGGYQGNLLIWGAANKFGISYQGQFKDVSNYAKNQNSYITILNVHNGGHWVLATGYSNGVYTVNDPGYQTTSYKTSEVVLGGVYKL